MHASIRIAAVASLFTAAATFAQTAPKYEVSKDIHIGGPGRWDYITVDSTTHNLYVTRSTHTQVIDSATGKVLADIEGGKGLHGVALMPSVNRAYITDGKAATLQVVDLKTNTLLGTIEAAEDADGIIYDAGSDRVLASCGDAGEMLILDPHADLSAAKVEKVELGGKPEYLAADGKGQAYVCLNDKNTIAVVDLKTKTVTNRWATGTGTQATGLAIDAKMAGCSLAAGTKR